jgi:hypothetical protein
MLYRRGCSGLTVVVTSGDMLAGQGTALTLRVFFTLGGTNSGVVILKV